jgi:hypothetical protein
MSISAMIPCGIEFFTTENMKSLTVDVTTRNRDSYDTKEKPNKTFLLVFTKST